MPKGKKAYSLPCFLTQYLLFHPTTSKFRRSCLGKPSRRVRRPAIHACSLRPCSGGSVAGCPSAICPPYGLGPGTRCTPGFGAGAMLGRGHGCWLGCKTRRACTGSWLTRRRYVRTKWRPARKKRQPRRPGARPQSGSYPVGGLHDQAPPELRRPRPDLRPGPGRPGLRCGLRARPKLRRQAP